jgi:hypothetical protein
MLATTEPLIPETQIPETPKEANMADNKTTPAPQPAETPITPIPVDAVAHATALVDTFASTAKLTPELKTQLHGMVLTALDERFKDTQDMKLGKILGSALATL